VNRRC
jgi:hypothetical protein